MPITPPAQGAMFNEDYPIIGAYVTDDDRIPYFNPANSGVMVLPGEPLLIQRGGLNFVYMAQGPIRPGEVGYLVRRFTADFPCELSANVLQGTEIWWDPSDTTASPAGGAKLTGNVTNGFRIGVASLAYDGHNPPATGAGGLPICGGTASTKIRVVSIDGVASVKGSYTTTAAPTTTTT